MWVTRGSQMWVTFGLLCGSVDQSSGSTGMTHFQPQDGMQTGQQCFVFAKIIAMGICSHFTILQLMVTKAYVLLLKSVLYIIILQYSQQLAGYIKQHVITYTIILTTFKLHSYFAYLKAMETFMITHRYYMTVLLGCL